MNASRPSEPHTRRARSYPATFLTTLPPALAIVPSASTTVAPRTRSRGAPKRWRSGPETLRARSAPIVGSPGGSRESRCPAAARTARSSLSRTPASTVHVRSPGSCSRTRSRSSAVRSSPIRSRRPSACAAASAADASSRLEALGNADPLECMDAVRPGHLATQAWRRDHLARVAEPDRVERAAQPLEHLQVALREHPRHRACLVHADAVLAGERAAGVEARVENRLCELPRLVRLARLGVVEDERVEVAVARVEDVADAQSVLVREILDAAQHLGEARAWNDAVLHVVVGRDASHRRERRLAPLSEERSVGVGRRRPDLERRAEHADPLELGGVVLDLLGHAVELDEEDGARTLRIARRDGTLCRLDREPIHHLD